MTINVAPTGLARDLVARAEAGRPIRIGLIGAGEMGTDIVTQVAHMPGLEIGAIADLNVAAGLRAAEIAYRWGFGDQTQFSRVFKAEFGVPPGEFRENARAGRLS